MLVVPRSLFPMAPYPLSPNTDILPLERPLCEDTVRRQLSARQEGGSQSGDALRIYIGKTNFCFHVREREAYLPSFLKLPYGP